jgi:hypothetical protein
MQPESIVPLVPAGGGHQFVFYGDCCSGMPGGLFESNFAKVNASLEQLHPPPDFILFIGDHVYGKPADAASLRSQWCYWENEEMAWMKQRAPVYHTTSNHDTADAVAEAVWREVFPDIPANGPPGQEGLSYWIRRDDLLLVCVNTNFSGLGGNGHVESAWLDATLETHADARHKIVAGHHPVFPVNGYGEQPLWCIVREEAEPFWSTLVRHKVLAYLCSHIIAFDAQQHDGVIQICSGGAGTNYGPGGFMGEGEYHHFVQAALDADGFRLQMIDTEQRVRERYTWTAGGELVDGSLSSTA